MICDYCKEDPCVSPCPFRDIESVEVEDNSYKCPICGMRFDYGVDEEKDEIFAVQSCGCEMYKEQQLDLFTGC